MSYKEFDGVINNNKTIEKTHLLSIKIPIQCYCPEQGGRKLKMAEPVNGLEYLAQLRQKYGIKTPNYLDVSSYLEAKAQKKGVPFAGLFELTPLCNLNCKMCYVHLTPEQLNGHSVLPVSTWKDLMHQAWQEGMFRATLTGGECLAYPGFEELYLYLHSLGCEVKVLTNGVLLDEKRIQFFKEHRVADIQVTLYGWNDDVYERVTGIRAFETVSRNITKALEAGLPVRVSTTPSIYLGEDLLETIRVGKKLFNTMEFNGGIITPWSLMAALLLHGKRLDDRDSGMIQTWTCISGHTGCSMSWKGMKTGEFPRNYFLLREDLPMRVRRVAWNVRLGGQCSQLIGKES